MYIYLYNVIHVYILTLCALFLENFTKYKFNDEQDIKILLYFGFLQIFSRLSLI